MEENLKFSLVIDDVFSILTQGTFITGTVLSGQIKKGDELEIRSDEKTTKTTCVKIEKYRREVLKASEGEHIGVFLSGVTKADLSHGMWLVIAD